MADQFAQDPDSRAAFEAWAKKVGWPHSWGYTDIDESGFDSASWDVWQAATQSQQERIAYVEKIADDAIELGNQQAIRIAKLEKHLQFVERWANHHGAKPHTTAKEALSVIQHYPPITAITRGYADGVVPDTFDPYARIAELEAQVQALSQDAGRYRWLRQEHERIDPLCHLTWKKSMDRKGNEWVNTANLDAAIDAAIAAGKGEG